MKIIEPGKDLTPKPLEIRCRIGADEWLDDLYNATDEEYERKYVCSRGDISNYKPDNGERRGCYSLLEVMPEDMFSGKNDKSNILCFCAHCGKIIDVTEKAKWIPSPLPSIDEFCEKNNIKWGIQ